MNTTNKIFIGWTFSAQNPHPTRHSSRCSKTFEPGIKKGFVILILWWFTRRSGIHKLFVRFIWIYNFSTFVLQSSNRRLRIWAWIETHFPQSPCDRESRAAKPTSGMVTILHFSLPLFTMDGFLKQPQSKLPPPFPRFVRFGYEGDGEDWYKAFQGCISDPKVVPNNVRLFERLFPNSVRKLMST